MPMTAGDLALTRQFLADEGSSAVQTILIEGATAGTFTLSYGGQTTAALDFDAGQNEVQNALCALSTLGVGQVFVNNTAPYVVYFDGTLAHTAVPMLTAASSLTPGTATITIVLAQPGGQTAFSDDQLNAFYDKALSNFALGVAYGFDALVAGGVAFNDYTAGQSNEKKSQIAEHLKERAEWWHQWANADRQVQAVGMQGTPPRVTSAPYTVSIPALWYTRTMRRGPWRNGGLW